MTLPPNVRDWPEPWRSEYEERAGMKEYDANKRREVAEAEAEECVRKRWRDIEP